MNPWVNHVKEFANKNNMSYSKALKHPNCSKSYKKKVGTGPAQSRNRVEPPSNRVQPENEEYQSVAPAQVSQTRVQDIPPVNAYPVLDYYTMGAIKELYSPEQSLRIDNLIGKISLHLELYNDFKGVNKSMSEYSKKYANDAYSELKKIVDPSLLTPFSALLRMEKVKPRHILPRVKATEVDYEELPRVRATEEYGSGARQSRVVPVDEPPMLTSAQRLEDLNNRLRLLEYNRIENSNDIRRDITEIRRLLNIGYDRTYRGIQEAQRSLDLSNLENQQIQQEIIRINQIIRNLTPQSSIDEEDSIRTASTGSGLKRIKKKR